MTGGSSTVDGSGDSRSRDRIEGRQPLPRRRATKISYCETQTGGFETDLALAVQESLKYARQAENSDKGNSYDESNNVEYNRNGFEEEKFLDPPPGECVLQSCAQLKDLLMIHMDLIQHQQEMLVQRDKEIRTLKSEKNMLKCRLERMERRMALLKHREDLTSDFVIGSPPRHSSHRHPIKTEEHSPEKGLKRKAVFEGEPVPKRSAVEENDSQSMRQASRNRRKMQSLLQDVKTTDLTLPNLTTRHKTAVLTGESSNQSYTSRQKTWTVTSVGDDGTSQKKLPPVLKDTKNDNVLRTSDPYFVSYYEPSGDYVDLSHRKDIIQKQETQFEVKLPSWRPKKYPSLWVLEGTENLEDEVFFKRHQKLEIEEKRRKRWDLQRMREQKIYDKLKEKERANDKKGETHNVESFYPSLDDITHIEVSNKIPVMAFGHALPNLKSMDFDIPWEIDTSKSMSTSRSFRHGRSR